MNGEMRVESLTATPDRRSAAQTPAATSNRHLPAHVVPAVAIGGSTVKERIAAVTRSSPRATFLGVDADTSRLIAGANPLGPPRRRLQRADSMVSSVDSDVFASPNLAVKNDSFSSKLGGSASPLSPASFHDGGKRSEPNKDRSSSDDDDNDDDEHGDLGATVRDNGDGDDLFMTTTVNLDATTASAVLPAHEGGDKLPTKPRRSRRAKCLRTCGRGICIRPFSSTHTALRHDAFFIISGSNPIRIFTYNVVHSRVFEFFIIALVLANCIQLAFEDPLRQGERPFAMRVLDSFFLAAFSVEMLLKTFALGFVAHHGAYLRSGWNRLDFVIVLLSYLDLVNNVGNVTALRALRVLRPLRSFNAIPQVKGIAMAMMKSFRGLLNVALLCLSIFAVFSIVAVQLWAGNFRMRCRSQSTGIVDEERFCRNDTAAFGELIGRECDEGSECVVFGNPNFGFTSFDNVPSALLVTIQVITLEGWAEIMHQTMDHSGAYTAVYFVLLVIIGSYFCLNLSLAVVSFEFGAARTELEERERQQQEMQMRSDSLLQMRRSLLGLVMAQMPWTLNRWRRVVASFYEEVEGEITVQTGDPPGASSASASNLATPATAELQVPSGRSGPLAVSFALSPAPSHLRASFSGRHPHLGASANTVRRPVPAQPGLLNRIMWLWGLARYWCFTLTEGPPHGTTDLPTHTTPFARVIAVMILANTVVLAAEHHGQTDTQREVSENLNYFFTAIFGVEMIARIIGLSLRGYADSLANVFDGVITTASIVELGFLGGSGGISALRTFRLLRVFHLTRRFPGLRQVVEVCVVALKETLFLNAIIFLYLLIASLLGMQLFGGKFPPADETGIRSSFDSFLSAFYTTFQVLTRDSWDKIMWMAMKSTSPAASLFFIACVFIGDLLILNIWLSVVLRAWHKSSLIAESATTASSASGGEDDEVDELDNDGRPVGDDGDETMSLANHAAVSGAFRRSSFVDMVEQRAPESRGGGGGSGWTITVSKESKRNSASNSRRGSSVVFLTSEALNAHNGIDGDSRQSAAQKPGASPLLPILSPGASSLLAAVNGFRDRSPFSDVPSAPGGAADVDEVAGARCPRCHAEIDPVLPSPISNDKVVSDAALHKRHCALLADITRCTKACDELLAEYGFVSAMPRSQSDGQAANAAPGGSTGQQGCINDATRPAQRGDDAGDVSDTEELLNFSDRASRPALLDATRTIDNGAGQSQLNVSWMVDAPSQSLIVAAVEKAQARQLLVHYNPAEVASDHSDATDWGFFHELLLRQREVLTWRVGCDQIGGALVAYTSANRPHETFTNGGKSLFLFGPRNRFRIFLTSLVLDPLFDTFILSCVIASSIVLALDNPRDPLPHAKTVSNAFTALFAVEAMMKIVANGFWFHRRAYLRDGWNQVDFFIVVVSGISEILDALSLGLPLGSLKAIRTFRALRPFLMINRNRGLKVIATSIVRSIPGIINVAIVGMVVFGIFAIVGVQFYKGALFRCNDGTVHARVNCTGTFVANLTSASESIVALSRINGSGVTAADPATPELIIVPRRWENFDWTFDNVAYSFLALFRAATLDNWGELMFAVIDSTDPDHGPVHNNAPYRGLFLIVFLIFGSLFFLSMFVGVILWSFEAARDSVEGLRGFVTDEQQKWIQTQAMMLNLRPIPRPERSKHPLRDFCFVVASDARFEIALMVVIVLNVAFISIEHFGQPLWVTDLTAIANIAFVCIFTVEQVVRIAGFGRHAFDGAGSRFDLFIVAISILDIALDGTLPINVAILRVFRIARLLRVMSLVKRARNLRVLLETLWFSLPSLANICAFLLLLLFIFAVVGMQLFSQIKRRGGLTHRKNFETFADSLLFLVQLMTLDDWGSTLSATMMTEDCGPATNANGWDDCGTVFAPFYYCTFILIASFVTANTVVSILLANFETVMNLSRSSVKMNDLTRFLDVWSVFDPRATLLVETRRFPALLASLQPPLGVTRSTGRIELLRLTAKYDIPEHGGVIHFIETMVPLARCSQCVDFSASELREHERRWRDEYPDIQDLLVLRYRQRRASVDQYLAATFIQAAYRRRIACRVANELRAIRQQESEAFATNASLELARLRRRESSLLLHITAARNTPPPLRSSGSAWPAHTHRGQADVDINEVSNLEDC